MAWLPISGTIPQYSTAANALAGDYWLKFYESGTATPTNMATDATGATELAKCKLSSDGYPISNSLDEATRFIPHIDKNYRIVLYTNETDADNNATANAAFNIDGMVLQVTPTADAENITLRDTTIAIQDDYDRSPLFIDGDGFTAGAGPHVITVPGDWTPTNADMRFYRVDNSGIVTVLTPTSTSSTAFTLAETLLSTDVIFIGDDRFRGFNIATQAEANESSGSELITVSTLAGRTASDTLAGILKVNNTLASTATGDALSAAQGKALNDARDPSGLWAGSKSNTGNPATVSIGSADLGSITAGTYMLRFDVTIGPTTIEYENALIVPNASRRSSILVDSAISIIWDGSTGVFQVSVDTGGISTVELTSVSRIDFSI